jgi:hypothetical protein
MHISGREKIWSGLIFFYAANASMNDKHTDKAKPPTWPESSEYGDALSDILKDQVRRKELRDVPAPTSGRPRLHPAIPPVLALVSVWLWFFPPSALRPSVPSIPPANQEAGLRMEMFMQVLNIQRYVSENGRLPSDLGEVGDGPEQVQYTLQEGNTFRLTGQVGDITVNFTSDESVEELLGNAIAVVSGRGSSPSGGAPAIEGAPAI